jgi:hypothetical protein
MGVQSFSISGGTNTLTSSQPVTTSASSQGSSFSSQIPLQAPSSVLPPSITPFAASSIAAPSSLTPILPNAGDVTAIQPPGSNAIPSVGASPSSGASGIIPPSGTVSNPSRPVLPPAGSGGVKPPAGTVNIDSGNSTVQPLFLYEGQNGARCNSEIQYSVVNVNGNFDNHPCWTPKDLDDFNEKKKDEIARSRGDVSAAIRLEKNDAYYGAKWVCEKAKSEVNCGDYVNRIGDSPFYDSLQPAQKVLFWQALNKGLSEGKVGEKGLQALTRFSMDFKLERTSSGTRLVYLGDAKNLAPVSPEFQVTDKKPAQGYIDVSLGFFIGLGGQVGLIFSFDKGVYVYGGIGVGLGGTGTGAQISGNGASPGCFTQWNVSAVGTVSMGQSGPNNESNFAEVGISLPGAAITVNCATTLIPPRR